MEKLKNWAKARDLLDRDSILYGIAHDNPEQTKPENCRYDTCIAIESDFPPDETIQTCTLAGGSYIIFAIPHTAEAIQQAWQEIFPLMTELDIRFDPNRPVLERYKNQLIVKHQCEICVPIQSSF